METKTQRTGELRIRSANVHVIGVCNYRCEHCFDRCLTHEFRTPQEWMPVLDHLKGMGIEKVNIAGGEPFLYPHLREMCALLKSMGFKVSIVSNGSRITEDILSDLRGLVDWIGLSIDSPDEDDEILIGRHVRGVMHVDNVRKTSALIRSFGIKVKINITVVRRSWNKDFMPFLEEIGADRVKVFRALTLKGANDDIPDTWSITDDQFADFVRRHGGCRNIVFEDNEDMEGSYLMFDPIGRWMVDKGGEKRFLPFEKLVREGLETNVDVSRYYGRNAVYVW